MAAGTEEMKQEQKRLAKEAVEERMKEQDEERPDPGQLPIVQSIATPSQGVSPEPRPEEGRGSGGGGEERAKELMAPGMPSIEDGGRLWMEGPRSPLFNEEQVRRIEELQRAAPLLMGRQQIDLRGPEIGRPAGLVEEEMRVMQEEAEKERQRERQRVFQRLNDQQKLEMLERIKTLEEDSKRLMKESEEMKKRNQSLIDTNQRLVEEVKKIREAEKKPREEFGTPAEFEENGGGEIPLGEGLGSTTPRMRGKEEEKKESPFDARMMMKGMMKLMEGMHVMQTQLLDVKKDSGLEVVRGGASELPKLPEWRAETAPLDLTDWLLTIGPAMGDLSNGSQRWWEETLEAARGWYTKHQEMPPLEKVTHKPEVPDSLKGERY